MALLTARMLEGVIQEAINRGEFDNLPGRGRPLIIPDEPVIFGILRHNGVAPREVLLMQKAAALAPDKEKVKEYRQLLVERKDEPSPGPSSRR